jgi:hypothetical protein
VADIFMNWKEKINDPAPTSGISKNRFPFRRERQGKDPYEKVQSCAEDSIAGLIREKNLELDNGEPPVG